MCAGGWGWERLGLRGRGSAPAVGERGAEVTELLPGTSIRLRRAPRPAAPESCCSSEGIETRAVSSSRPSPSSFHSLPSIFKATSICSLYLKPRFPPSSPHWLGTAIIPPPEISCLPGGGSHSRPRCPGSLLLPGFREVTTCPGFCAPKKMNLQTWSGWMEEDGQVTCSSCLLHPSLRPLSIPSRDPQRNLVRKMTVRILRSHL
uniref:uncharacterized protein LOC114589679 n=1 Tax=Podarcis muralis TaxID=64176 RepID=UPI00109FA6F1|nr:uncharacterized protein LOC114589679 [Podarcis muralis]